MSVEVVNATSMLFLLFVALALGSNPVYFNTCDEDTDCFYMNGRCSVDGRCVCAQGLLFNETNWRCYPSTGVSLQYTAPVYYPWQSAYTALMLTTPGQMPSNWSCTVDFAYCQGTQGVLEWTMFNQSLNGSSWRCAADKGLRPAVRSVTVATNYSFPLTPDLQSSCVDCDTYCGTGYTGQCVDDACVCDTGWTGQRCQLTTTSPQLYNLPSVSCHNDTSCPANQLCYWSVYQRGNYCWCDQGYAVSQSTPSVCYSATMTVYQGALSAQNESLQFDYSWSSFTPYGYYTDTSGHLNAVHSVYPITAGVINVAMRVDHSTVWLIHHGSAIANATNATTAPLNCTGNFSYYSNETLQCECPIGFIYLNESCDYSQYQCSTDRCSSQGYCDQSQTGCVCFNGYYGDHCEFDSGGCSVFRCNGTGTCLTQSQACTCQQWSTGFDCSQLECTNNGTLISSNQCVCTVNFTGPSCQWYRCGRFGYWSDGQCQCVGGLHGLSIDGNCTVDLCNNGQWSNDETYCVCDKGFVYNSTSQRCQGLCLNGGRTDSNGQCQCREGYSGDLCEYGNTWEALRDRLMNDPVVIFVLTFFTGAAVVLPVMFSLFLYNMKRQTISYSRKMTVAKILRKMHE
jgi:hypothetical protein